MRKLLLLALLTSCKERIRIHEEQPIITEAVCPCTYVAAVIPVCTHMDKVQSCHMNYVHANGYQRCRVTRVHYSYRYEDDKPGTPARVDTEETRDNLEGCH